MGSCGPGMVRCKAKIKPIVLSTFTMSSARLGFGLWLKLGQGEFRYIIRLWGWGLGPLALSASVSWVAKFGLGQGIS